MTDDTDENATAPERRTLRDRTLGLRGVAAVALAAVVLGGAGGVALGAVTDGSDDGGTGQFGGRGGMPGGMPAGGPGGQLQAPPAQPGATSP